MWKRLAMVAALMTVGSAALATDALGAHPVSGALYTGNSGVCAASISRECVFKFRVSSDGRTLRFVKKGVAIFSWGCRNGGGEAVFGSAMHDFRIPPARIRSSGAFSGSNGVGSRRLLITGSFTGSGNTARLKFVLPKQHCHTPELEIVKR